MTAISLLNIHHYYEIDAQEEIYENKNLGIKFTIPEKLSIGRI
jgi:hypothetical protein